MDHVTIASSLQWAFNIFATGTLGTVVAAMVKGKSDLKIQTNALEAAQKISDQTGERADDLQLAARQKVLDDRAKEQYAELKTDRDYWKAESLRVQGVLEARDKCWTEIGTTYSEAFSIVKAVRDRINKPGDFPLLPHQD